MTVNTKDKARTCLMLSRAQMAEVDQCITAAAALYGITGTKSEWIGDAIDRKLKSEKEKMQI